MGDLRPGWLHPIRTELELDFERRARKWIGTSVFTWAIWAVTGAPTGWPRGVGTAHGLTITLGLWPAYLMVCGFLDLAGRASRLSSAPTSALDE